MKNLNYIQGRFFFSRPAFSFVSARMFSAKCPSFTVQILKRNQKRLLQSECMFSIVERAFMSAFHFHWQFRPELAFQVSHTNSYTRGEVDIWSLLWKHRKQTLLFDKFEILLLQHLFRIHSEKGCLWQ